MSVDAVKTDLLTSTKVGTTKEKKLHENIVTLKKQTTILETSLNDQEDNIASKYETFIKFDENVIFYQRIEKRKF